MTFQFPNLDALIQTARERTGLSDFSEEWFFENIRVLLKSLEKDARLSEAGFAGACEMIIGGLCNRLNHVQLVKDNPEIKDEEINVAAIVVGLPRTGSTLLHRMLANANGMTAVKWYEAQNYTLLAGEDRHDPTPRREAGQMIMDYMLTQIPEIMSIHPLSLDQPDEEVIIMGQLFSSSMIESTYYVPDYAHWLMRQDKKKPYEDLYEILQSLQWQDASRKGKSWVLKTPGHLMALAEVMDVYPNAKIVMTHRDPVNTVPSYCSMEATLYRMNSDDITPDMIGAFWRDRLLEWTNNFMTVRAKADPERFIDVRYQNLLENPIDEADRVLTASGLAVTDAIRDGMAEWIEGNKREHRAPHKYDIQDFGLNTSEIETLFSHYRETFIL